MSYISCVYGELSPGLSLVLGRPASQLKVRALEALREKGKSKGNGTGLPAPDMEAMKTENPSTRVSALPITFYRLCSCFFSYVPEGKRGFNMASNMNTHCSPDPKEHSIFFSFK